MQVIAISNRKGGTGKTTVLVNLAAGFAAAGRRVLLVDLDSQGHCAVGLGVKVGAGETAAHRIFVDPAAKLSDAIRDTAVPNLALAPADPRFDHGAGERNDTRLKTALTEENLASRFDLVVIATAEILQSADRFQESMRWPIHAPEDLLQLPEGITGWLLPADAVDTDVACGVWNGEVYVLGVKNKRTGHKQTLLGERFEVATGQVDDPTQSAV
jgi:hypothetical protein